MADLYHGEYPVDMTPAEARAELASRERETLHSPEEQRRLSDAVEAQARRTAVADTVSVTQADATFVADILELAETLELAGNDVASVRNGIWNDEPSDLGRLLRMAAKHRLASAQPAPAFPREEVAITEREVGALRYLLNWSDTGKKVATVMKTFTLDGEERHYTKDTLESLWRTLSAALLQGKQP